MFGLNTSLFLNVNESYMFRLYKIAIIRLNTEKINRKENIQLQLLVSDLKRTNTVVYAI
jgi:hypothetical protein